MKILIRATNWVGDAIMAVPALQAVRARWPEAHLSVLARPWVADLYRGQGIADSLIVYEYQGRHRGVLGRERLMGELRREKFDAALLLQNAWESAWLVWRSGIPKRIGYARNRRSWFLTRAIKVPVKGEIPAHESYYYLELLRRLGWLERLPATVPHITLNIADGERLAAAQRLVSAGARPGAMWIAFAPGAAFGSAKCWEPERYAALADELIAAYDADVILFGTPQESEMAARIERSMRRRALNLVGATKIGELPALLAACRLFVGNDSGAMHVAGAAGLPIVGIFGPTDPDGTSPATPHFALVRQPVSCSPCFLRHCPIDHRCMTRVSVSEVLVAAESLLASADAPISGSGPQPRSTASID